MERSEIETKLREAPKEVRSRIEKAPLPAFLVGFIFGALLVAFPEAFITIIVLAAIALGVLWFMSSAGKKSKAKAKAAQSNPSKESSGEKKE